MKAALNSSSVSINPSKTLINYIKNIEGYKNAPPAILSIRLGQSDCNEDPKPTDHANLVTEKDSDFIKTLDLEPALLKINSKGPEIEDKNLLLSLDDLLWLWNKIQGSSGEKPHLHELLMGSQIVYPQNVEIPRSEELDKRCNYLQRQQENREYKAITKNVDNVRKPHPEDTISYQLKQMNRQLIAVAQFIISVLAGFLFGFHGIELMVGTLDFGFRLLLGVICSLTIALAELYFLAKKLNEDLQYEVQVENKTAQSKLN